MGRVVVTGLGAVSPLGIGVPALWDGLVAGRSGVRRVQHFDTDTLPVKIAAEVPDFDPRQFMDSKSARRMDRFAQFAIAATHEALEDAGLKVTDENRERIAIVINTGGGGIPSIEANVTAMAVSGPSRVGPLVIPMFAPNMASSQVSITFGILGPTITSAAACASGVQAYVDAVRLLRCGEADVVITGGTEAGITPVALTSLSHMTHFLNAMMILNGLHVRSTRTATALSSARVRGSSSWRQRSTLPVVALMCTRKPWAARSRPTRFISPHQSPLAGAPAQRLTNALKRAEMSPEDIDYIAAHATATPLGDTVETRAIKGAMGDHAVNIAVSANKSMVGHMLGAAGAISAISSVLAIRDGVVPPTINLQTPDPECDLNYVPNVAERRQVDAAMVNGFGFGGQNASTIFRRFRG